MAAAARETLQSQVEHLQMKYVGTGHADISKHDWLVNQHRDSIASYIGHPSMLTFMAVAENESPKRVQHELFKARGWRALG